MGRLTSSEIAVASYKIHAAISTALNGKKVKPWDELTGMENEAHINEVSRHMAGVVEIPAGKLAKNENIKDVIYNAIIKAIG